MTTLEEILAYRNEDVISRFLDLYDVEEEEARDLFQETLKFLFLTQKGDAFIPDDLLILDEMWHNFVLFTKEYAHFCQRHFGGYNHHHPATKAEKEARTRVAQEAPEARKAENLANLGKLLELTFDHLGPETVQKWFQVYPEKYSPDRIRALRR
jgi:hypothetical protein